MQQRPISNAMRVGFTGERPWLYAPSNVICKTTFSYVFELTNRVCVGGVWTGTVTFSIANAETLLNSGHAAFNDLAAPFTAHESREMLDFLPFVKSDFYFLPAHLSTC